MRKRARNHKILVRHRKNKDNIQWIKDTLFLMGDKPTNKRANLEFKILLHDMLDYEPQGKREANKYGRMK